MEFEEFNELNETEEMVFDGVHGLGEVISRNVGGEEMEFEEVNIVNDAKQNVVWNESDIVQLG